MNSSQEPKNDFLCSRKAEVTYPCLWLYKVIGKDAEAVREAILLACAPAPVQITPSHASSGGAYRSFNAELEVKDETMRLEIYRLLTEHPAVKFVL